MVEVDQKDPAVDGKELLRQYRAKQRQGGELVTKLTQLKKQVENSGEDYDAFCKAQTALEATKKEYFVVLDEEKDLYERLEKTSGCNQ